MKTNISFKYHSKRMIHVWVLLILPSILIGFLIFGYVAVFQLDINTPDFDEKIRRSLPYILGLNHILIFFALLYFLSRRNESLVNTGWNLSDISSKIGIELLVGLISALLLYLFKELVWDAINALLAGNKPTFTTLFNFKLHKIYVPMAVVATGFVFIEESIFRGFALPRLAEKYGLALAVTISTFFFALIHWGNGPMAILSTFITGLFLALIFVKRGNLVAVTIAHAGYNFLILAT